MIDRTMILVVRNAWALGRRIPTVYAIERGTELMECMFGRRRISVHTSPVQTIAPADDSGRVAARWAEAGYAIKYAY